MVKAKALKIVDGSYKQCDRSEATHLELLFPLKFEPLRTRIITVGGSGWGWNGSLEAPTLNPSVLSRWEGGDPFIKHVCHSFVTDGMVNFLGDCTHELAGQIAPLCDVSEDG